MWVSLRAGVTCVLVCTCWHVTGSELTLKHCVGEESTYCTSLSPPSWEPAQLLPSCSLFIPPSSGSTEKSQGWRRTPGTSHSRLCFSILERHSSNLSIRTPRNGGGTFGQNSSQWQSQGGLGTMRGAKHPALCALGDRAWHSHGSLICSMLGL